METPDSIREFWFGAHADDALAAAEKARLWWAKNPAVDAAIRLRFADTLAAAARGALAHWEASPPGRLALILLTDQFPRNMYRDTGQAFAYDGLARTWCSEGLALGSDRHLRPIERVFFYLPLEHAEALDDQNRSVALFASLLQSALPEHRALFEGFYDYAVRHRAVIARFGRFPHRNAILDRESSSEEAAFLREKGSSF